MKINYNEERRIFELDGQRVPSVTELIPKPDFSFVNPEVLENARQEGNEMHKDIEDYFTTGDTLENPDIERLDVFLKSQADLIGDFVCSEKRFCYDDVLPFVGKPDA